jgi:hypothetical protein
MRSALLNLGQWCNTKPPKNLKQLDLIYCQNFHVGNYYGYTSE